MSRKSKTPTALASAERNLAGQLPALIDTAVESYRRFALADPPEDAKSYAAQQTACKAALAHLDLLLRLAPGASRPHHRCAAARGYLHSLPCGIIQLCAERDTVQPVPKRRLLRKCWCSQREHGLYAMPCRDVQPD